MWVYTVLCSICDYTIVANKEEGSDALYSLTSKRMHGWLLTGQVSLLVSIPNSQSKQDEQQESHDYPSNNASGVNVTLKNSSFTELTWQIIIFTQQHINEYKSSPVCVRYSHLHQSIKMYNLIYTKIRLVRIQGRFQCYYISLTDFQFHSSTALWRTSNVERLTGVLSCICLFDIGKLLRRHMAWL